MPTLAEIVAQKMAAAAAAASAVAFVPVPPPDNLPPPEGDFRELGFTDKGEHIPMAFPSSKDGKAWESARHSQTESLAVLVEGSSAWLCCCKKGHEPIYLLGPLPVTECPF